ncbi:MAG: hypothetical protein ACAI25_18000 [Planctomycetota bacterium]
MPDANEHDRKLRAIVGEKIRDTLGVEGRQALFSAACLMAFADLDLAEPEGACLTALSAYLASAPQGSRVTTRRQTREQLLATFREAKLAPEAATAVLACIAYVASADGVVKPAERALLLAIGEALGQGAAATTAILERIAGS